MDALDFRLGRYSVRVHPSFLMVVGVSVLFQLQARAPLWVAGAWGVVVFVSVLVHELGHAEVARRLGVPVGAIELHFLGGQVTRGATTPGRALLISLAGPGAGLLLAAGAFALEVNAPPLGRVADTMVGWLVAVNVTWSLFNLLPLHPLDGGHALQSALALGLGARRSWFWTSGVGVVLGTLLLAAGLASQEMFLAFVGGASAYANWQIFQSLPR